MPSFIIPINRIIITGYLAMATELIILPDQTPSARFGLGIARGPFKYDTFQSYIDVVCYRDLALKTYKDRKVGDPLLIEGRVRQRVWTQNGKKCSRHQINAYRILPLPRYKRFADDFEQEEESFDMQLGEIPGSVAEPAADDKDSS